jgi:peptide/nickel transport system substrate-binding protein
MMLVASGCASEGTKQSPQAAPSRVRIAWADVGVPTPFRVSTAGPGGPALLTLIYDTLLWKDEHGIIPWLAETWSATPDGRSFTFRLAPGVTWQDAQPLNAHDVAFTFEYYARHPYRWTSTAIVDGVDVVDATTVRITLKAAYAPFIEDIAAGVPIIPAHVWASVDDPYIYDGPDASLGSGPYRLDAYDSAAGAYRLLANPGYFKGPPAVAEIQQLNTPVETRIQAIQQAQLELMLATDASVDELVTSNPRLRVFSTAPLSVVRLALNTERSPLHQVSVRQALAYAVDGAHIGETLTRGPAVRGSPGVIPPETPWFNPRVRTYEVDRDRARALLDGRPLTVELLADPTAREPELLQPMLEAVGIRLDVRRADVKTRTQLLRDRSFQLALLTHIGVGGDPDFLRRWYAGEETNDFAQGSVFFNAEFDALAGEAASTIDPAARRARVDRLQEILADQLPTIPLYYRRFYWVYDHTQFAPMNTWGGLLNGAPLVANKLAFLRGR